MEFSIADIRDACSLHAFSQSALYIVAAIWNSQKSMRNSDRSGPSISYSSSLPSVPIFFSRIYEQKIINMSQITIKKTIWKDSSLG